MLSSIVIPQSEVRFVRFGSSTCHDELQVSSRSPPTVSTGESSTSPPVSVDLLPPVKTDKDSGVTNLTVGVSVDE